MSRTENDAYYTDPKLARALVGLLPLLPEDRVWEPHVGAGAFVWPLRDKGCIVLGSDIDPTAKGLESAHISRQHDVLDGCPFDGPIDWVVGNPPFSNFESHINMALNTGAKVAFLLRLSALASKKRSQNWQGTNPWPLRVVWVLAQRPSFTGGGTDSSDYGWFWFDPGFHGRPELVPCWSWK